jgi:hypothetical protein
VKLGAFKIELGRKFSSVKKYITVEFAPTEVGENDLVRVWINTAKICRSSKFSILTNKGPFKYCISEVDF